MTTERCFDETELQALREALETQQLYRGTRGNFVARFEEAMAAHLGRTYVYAVNSGTSANEAALAGLGLQPGDEVICPATAPIFVSLPVFAAGAIPVFAEVDPRTLIISPEGIEARLSQRTRAVVVVHLFGQPAPVDDIQAVARRHGLHVVEDCAQCYDGTHRGRKTGTMGTVACYSLQSSKHMTSGEGGFIATDDPEVYQRAVLYSNAGMPWYLHGLQAPSTQPVAGVPTRGHFAFGHNHRMGELQGAVACAQLPKLERFNAARRRLVEVVTKELQGCPGIELPHVYPETVPNYWLYPVRLRSGGTSLTAAQVSRLCHEKEGVGPGYYQEVNYLEEVFRLAQERRRTPHGYPLPEHVQYCPGLCPRAEEAARRLLFVLTHHAVDPEQLRRQAIALRRTMHTL
ncbi:MAG: DegT/DnrJ/EryC1/StrS family aminotransferase [Candidatus Latescibacterota bacterium]